MCLKRPVTTAKIVLAICNAPATLAVQSPFGGQSNVRFVLCAGEYGPPKLEVTRESESGVIRGRAVVVEMLQDTDLGDRSRMSDVRA